MIYQMFLLWLKCVLNGMVVILVDCKPLAWEEVSVSSNREECKCFNNIT